MYSLSQTFYLSLNDFPNFPPPSRNRSLSFLPIPRKQLLLFRFLLQFLSLARRFLFPTFLLSSFLPSFLIRSRSIESFDNVSPRQHRNNTCDSPTLSAKLPGREWNCKSGEARLSHTESRELSDAATTSLSSPPPIPDRGRKTRYWMERETEREKRRRRIRFRAWDGEARRCPRAKLP